MMRMLLRAAPALLLLRVTAYACEPRIDEPTPAAKKASVAEATSAALTVPATAASSAPAAPARCIKPTPAIPTRTVTGPVPDPRCPRDPDGNPKLKTGKVSFPEAKNEAVTVEITERDEDRQRGLMYRKSMPEDRGMIFTFEERENHRFWMHNTCIPLDMLFIDRDGTIVGIEENTSTMDDSTFEVGCPSSYVLELNAGWTRKHGVKAGQKVKLEGI